MKGVGVVEQLEKLINDEIMAIIPLYMRDKGNSTKIITKTSKDTYIYKRLLTVLKLIASYYMVDLYATRKYCGNLIGVSNIVPIIFNTENIFVPIKTRKPISRNDGSFAYFNSRFINNIETENSDVYIVLEDNVRIKSLQSSKTTQKHINDGKIINKIYKDRTKDVIRESESYYYSESTKPATKADIAVIMNEIMDIKSKLIKN